MMLRNSLTTRLVLFFTTAALLIVLGLATIFVFAIQQHFVALDRAVLSDKQHLIQDILASSSSLTDSMDRLTEALGHHHGLFVLIRDAQGRNLFASDGFEFSREFMAKSDATVGEQLTEWRDKAVEYRALGAWFKPQNGSGERVAIVVVLDTTHQSVFLRSLGRGVVFYVIVASIVVGVLAWISAYQGLAPLRSMRQFAAAVTGSGAGPRMPVATVPIEMASLAMELNQMLDRIQADSKKLSDFSSDLAHELRTPINNLLTQTQVALSQARAADQYREVLYSNAEELQRLARMVADMLYLAKTEQVAKLPTVERFQAEVEAHSLVEFYEALSEEKALNVTLSGNGIVAGDRLMFRRALSNLLSNAIRHTPEKGTVSVMIAQGPANIRVIVENSGTGIDERDLPRLFDRFFRADPSRAHPASEGAGLGLSITKAIVEAHGGTVHAESSANSTRFIVQLPTAS